MVWAPVGLLLASLVQGLLVALALISIGYVAVMGVAGAICLLWVTVLVDATAGPIIQQRMVGAALAGIGGSLFVLLILPRLAGL
jgi:hypothetical protein